MYTSSNGLMNTHASDVRAARVNYAGGYRTADLYGQPRKSRSVTPYMVTLTDGRERRVYAAMMSDGSQVCLFVRMKGEDVLLDEATCEKLARMHSGQIPEFHVSSRTHAELVADMKSEILADVAAGHVPADVTDYSTLHDHTDANMYGWREEDEDDDFSTAEVWPAQEDVHQWLAAGGIREAGNGTLVTDQATTDRAWATLANGFGESVGDLSDGDDFWAAIVTYDDRTWFGAVETTQGQRTVYELRDEEAASIWLAIQRARLESAAGGPAFQDDEEEDEGIVSERQARAARGQVGWDGSSSELGDPRAWPL